MTRVLHLWMMGTYYGTWLALGVVAVMTIYRVWALFVHPEWIRPIGNGPNV